VYNKSPMHLCFFFFFNSSLNRHAKGTAYSLILQYFWEWRWEYIIFIYLFIDKKRTNERIITFIKYHLRTKVPNNHIYIYIYGAGEWKRRREFIYLWGTLANRNNHVWRSYTFFPMNAPERQKMKKYIPINPTLKGWGRRDTKRKIKI
jgi:hypothetical protein